MMRVRFDHIAKGQNILYIYTVYEATLRLNSRKCVLLPTAKGVAFSGAWT